MASGAVWYMHYAATGWNEKARVVPAIDATGLILATQGCDQLLIPGWGAADDLGEVVASLEGPMARRVKIVDKRGSMLKRIVDFVEPLGIDYSNGGPPMAQPFPNLVIPHLYQLALACKYEASVAGQSSQRLLQKILELDTDGMDAEAKYRLAQILSLLTGYDAFHATRISPTQKASQSQIRERFEEMLDAAEFERVVARSGYLGFLREPMPGLRQLKRAVANVVSKPRFKPYAQAFSAGTELLTGQPGASVMADLVPDQERADFSPPVLDLTHWDIDIYRASLKAHGLKPADPDSVYLHVHRPIVCGQIYASISKRRQTDGNKLMDLQTLFSQARNHVAQIRGSGDE